MVSDMRIGYRSSMEMLGGLFGSLFIGSLLLLSLAWMILPFIIMSRLGKLIAKSEEQVRHLAIISHNMEVTARALSERRDAAIH